MHRYVPLMCNEVTTNLSVYEFFPTILFDYYFYSKTNKMHQCIKFILFCNDTLHVSDGLSVHHQQFKIVHTATDICQTDTAVCLLASRQQCLFDALVHLVGFTIEIILQWRPYERQIYLSN